MCPAASVTKYKRTLHNIPEERRSPLHRAGSLGSHKERFFLVNGKGMPFLASLELVYQTSLCHKT
jgi:hypothetical protein